MTTRTRRRSWWQVAAKRGSEVLAAVAEEIGTRAQEQIEAERREPTYQLRNAVIARDKSKCVYCSKGVWGKGLHIDHKYPWSKGGRTTYTNLQVTCWQCNKEKGDMTDREYRRLRERQAWAGRR